MISSDYKLAWRVAQLQWVADVANVAYTGRETSGMLEDVLIAAGVPIPNSSVVSAANLGVFGDGSGGSYVLDGVNTYGGITLAGSTYTLAIDVFAASFTVSTGITLVPSSHRIFCTGTFTNNGTILASGGAGAAGGGAGSTNGAAIMGAGGTGGAGATGAGSASVASLTAIAGGAGGVGSVGAAGAASAPVLTSTSTIQQMFRLPAIMQTCTFAFGGAVRFLQGTAGGGGGGGDGINKGGGGGSGCSPIFIAAAIFVNAGAITAIGGAGGTPTVGNCGGGGGGGGGLVIIYSLTAATLSGTATLTGGAAGSGVGTGAAGAAGSTGVLFAVTLI